MSISNNHPTGSSNIGENPWVRNTLLIKDLLEAASGLGLILLFAFDLIRKFSEYISKSFAGSITCIIAALGVYFLCVGLMNIIFRVATNKLLSDGKERRYTLLKKRVRWILLIAISICCLCILFIDWKRYCYKSRQVAVLISEFRGNKTFATDVYTYLYPNKISKSDTLIIELIDSFLLEMSDGEVANRLNPHKEGILVLGNGTEGAFDCSIYTLNLWNKHSERYKFREPDEMHIKAITNKRLIGDFILVLLNYHFKKYTQSLDNINDILSTRSELLPEALIAYAYLFKAYNHLNLNDSVAAREALIKGMKNKLNANYVQTLLNQLPATNEYVESDGSLKDSIPPDNESMKWSIIFDKPNASITDGITAIKKTGQNKLWFEFASLSLEDKQPISVKIEYSSNKKVVFSGKVVYTLRGAGEHYNAGNGIDEKYTHGYFSLNMPIKYGQYSITLIIDGGGTFEQSFQIVSQ